VGGRRCCRGPPLTRLAACPWGILWPGFSNSMPGSKRVQREISYVLSREHHLAGRAAVSAVFGLCRDQAARLADRPFPIGRPGRPPMQGANRVAPGRPRGVRGTPLPFLPACGDLQPRTMSWPVTRTSVIPIDRSGAAPGGRGRERAVPRKRRRPQGKLRQATGETELWRALSRRGRMVG
jgi:hypothetical protein